MTKITFKDLPDTTTPLNASNLNTMQENIEDAIDNVAITLDSAVSTSSTNGVENQAITNYVDTEITDVLQDAEDYADGKISNSYGTSQTIGYSQQYINNNIKTKTTTLWSGSKNTTGDISLNDSIVNYDLIAITIATPTSTSCQIYFFWVDEINFNSELNFSILQKSDTYASASCKFSNNTTFNVIKFSTTGSWSSVWIRSIRGIKL